MATTTKAKTVSEAQTDERVIESGRLTRALTENMDVRKHAPMQYLVTHNDESHLVDIEVGAGDCDDYQYRGSQFICKHTLRACIHAVFTDGVRTRLQARVVRAVNDLGCPHENDCAGVCAPHSLPCQSCLDGIRADGVDEWTVWQTLVDSTGGAR